MNRRFSARVTFSLVSGYLLLLIILPIGAIFEQAFAKGSGAFVSALRQPIGLSALVLTFQTALITAIINTIAGTIVAYALVRTPIPGKRWLNAIIDLPFAVPDTVIGMMLVFLYGTTSPVGEWFAKHGIKIIYSPIAIVLAMIIVTFPYTVRAVQPLLADMDPRTEEAARTLGAGGWRIIRTIIFPIMRPGILSGFTLSFSRALADFGAVVIVAGNMPMHTQVSAVYLYGLVENYDPQGAATISVVLLVLSFLAMLYQFYVLHRPSRRKRTKHRHDAELALGGR